jgi:hypothetical protein
LLVVSGTLKNNVRYYILKIMVVCLSRKGLVGFAKIGVGVAFALLLVGLFVVYISPVFVSGASFNGEVVGPSVVTTPNSNQKITFNITNTDSAQNITEVNITLPDAIKAGENFAFIAGSNETNAGATSFANAPSTVLSWQNATPAGFIENGGWAIFNFNVSLPDYPGVYSFNVSTWDTADNYNSTIINITVQQPVQPGQLPASWGDNASSPPFFWVNITRHVDFFFADGMTVYMSAKFVSPQQGQPGIPGLNVTVNFTSIGDGMKQAVDMGNGYYEANGTINYSAIGTVRQIDAGMVSIIVRNGTDIVDLSVWGGPMASTAPVILVNMSTMPGCPPADDPVGIPPAMMWDNGSGTPQLWYTANCTPSGQAPCTSGVPGPVQINSTHIVLCGPNWGPETTNFTAIAAQEAGNFSNVKLVLQIPGIAKINFTEGVDFMGQQGQRAAAIMEFAMKNLMSAGKFGVNESEWDGGNHSGRFKPRMVNISARLTLYNLSELMGISDGGIAFGDFAGMNAPNETTACPVTRCSNIIWDGENLTFTVSTFSTYVAGNVTHNLTFVNLTALTSTVVTNQNATYYINITNNGNATSETYNLSTDGIGLLNNSAVLTISLNQSDSVVVELKVLNATAGTYNTVIVANHVNDTGGLETDWNLSSDDDNVTFVTTVQEASITISYPTTGLNISSSGGIWLNFTNNSALDSCYFIVNGSAESNVTIPGCSNILIASGNFTEGLSQNITIRANDTYGNGGASMTLNDTVVFNIDNTAPAVSITTPSNNANKSGAFDFNASVTDATTGVYQVWYNITNSSNNQIAAANLSDSDGDGNWTVSINTTALSISDGAYNITVYGRDYILNTNSSEFITVTIDNSEPSVTINSPDATTYNANFTINVTVTETGAGVDVVQYNITNSSGSAASAVLTKNGASSNYNTTFDISVLADGSYNLTIIANNTAGLTNNTEKVEFTIDTTAPTLTNWSYNFITKQLTLGFSETVNIGSLDLSKFNITYNDGSAQLVGLSSGTMASTSNTSSVVVNFTNAMDQEMSVLRSRVEGEMDMATGGIKDMAGNDASAATDVGYTAYTVYTIDIDLTTALWNEFSLPRISLENASSLSSNYSVTNVLSSVDGNYRIIYYYNTTSWASYQPGRATNDFTEFTANTLHEYWIYMNGTDRLQIQ